MVFFLQKNNKDEVAATNDASSPCQTPHSSPRSSVSGSETVNKHFDPKTRSLELGLRSAAGATEASSANGAKKDFGARSFGGEDIFHNLDDSQHDLERIKQSKTINFRKKLRLFYWAPITKYYCHLVISSTISAIVIHVFHSLSVQFTQLFYGAFLALYTFISVVKTPVNPSLPELYVVSWMVSTACELLRTFQALEPVELRLKLR